MYLNVFRKIILPYTNVQCSKRLFRSARFGEFCEFSMKIEIFLNEKLLGGARMFELEDMVIYS